MELNTYQSELIPYLTLHHQGSDMFKDASTFLIGLCKVKIEFRIHLTESL